MASRLPILLLTFLVLSIGRAQATGESLPDRKLIVGTKEAPPFSMKTSDGDWTGISIDLWRDIAAALNLKFEFRELGLKQLIEGVANRSLDAAVAALTVTPEREKMLDFTHAFYSTGLGIAATYKKVNPWAAVFKRFLSLAFLKVVATLAFLLFGVGLLVWWFEHKKNRQQFNGNAAKGIGSGFWWSAVTMTTVGYGDKAPVTFGGRLVALIWMFVAIIVISSFTASITSSLTVTQLEALVKGPDDLPRFPVGSVENTTGEEYLRDGGISFRPYKTPLDGLKALQAKEIDALVYDAPILRYLIHRDFQGKLYVLPDRLLKQDYAIALPAESPLREPINVILLQKIREKAWQDKLKKYLGE